MQHNTPGMSCGAADSTGRFETHLVLKGGSYPQRKNHTDATNPSITQAQITDLLLQQVKDWNEGNIDALEELFYKDRPELVDAPQVGVTLDEQARERFQEDKAEGVQGQESVYNYSPKKEMPFVYENLKSYINKKSKYINLSEVPVFIAKPVIKIIITIGINIEKLNFNDVCLIF